MTRRRAVVAAIAVALALTASASAQIGHPPGALVAALGLTEEAVAGERFETPGGVRASLVVRGRAIGAVRGEAELGPAATLPDAALLDLAALVAAATGIVGIEGPVAEFLGARVSALVGQGQVVVGVERFRLTLEVLGDEGPSRLAFGLALAEVESSAFPAARHAVGPDDAAIVVREFSDFQCPFCRRFALEVKPQVTSRLLARGDVRFEYHHFPLRSIHANASRAAEASECAADAAPRDGDAFWRFHDALYDHQGEWAPLADPDRRFVGMAGDVGLDADVVAACLAAGAHRDTVERAYQAAVALQLRGTPTLFVNGFQLDDFTSLAAYLEAIELVEAFAEGEDDDE